MIDFSYSRKVTTALEVYKGLVKKMEIINKAKNTYTNELLNITNNVKTNILENRELLLNKAYLADTCPNEIPSLDVPHFELYFDLFTSNLDLWVVNYDLILNNIIGSSHTISIMNMSGQHVILQLILHI